MKKSLQVVLSALGVLAVLGSVAFGHFARTNVDIGHPGSDKLAQSIISQPGLRVSNTNQDQLTPSEYFYSVTQLLQREYVDPIEVDDKMAAGAVKGMVNSLLDPDSVFMAPAAYEQFRHVRQGEVEGVGVEIRYVFDADTIKKAQSGAKGYDPLLLLPQVVVAAVIPGGPAQEAGIKAGDEVRMVGDKYVVTAKDIKALRDMQVAVNEKKESPEKLEALRKSLQDKVKLNIPPNKVRDQLTLGDKGRIDLVLSRNGVEVKASMDKKRIQLPAVKQAPDGSYAVRMVEGADTALARLDWSKPVTLDLRQSTQGDFAVMLKCIDALLPAGKVGEVSAEAGRKFEVASKGPGLKADGVTLLVDDSTSGAAAAFAEALSSQGFAKVQGKTSSDLEWIEDHALPDGSGYTLAVGKFRPTSKEGSK